MPQLLYYINALTVAVSLNDLVVSANIYVSCGPLARPPDAFPACAWCNRSFKQPSGLGKHKQSCPKRPCSEPSDTTCSNNDSVSIHVDSIVCPKCTRSFKAAADWENTFSLAMGNKNITIPPPHTPAPIAPALLAAKEVSHCTKDTV